MVGVHFGDFPGGEAGSDLPPPTPLFDVGVTVQDRIAIVYIDGEPKGLEVRRVPCAACDYSGEDEPASGAEPPLVRGALDDLAEAEKRSAELRTMLLRVCNFFGDREPATYTGTVVQALIDEARRVAK